MTGAINKAQDVLKATPDSFMLQQFDNPANPEVHYKHTGPEIWRDTAGQVDILVCGEAQQLAFCQRLEGPTLILGCACKPCHLSQFITSQEGYCLCR